MKIILAVLSLFLTISSLGLNSHIRLLQHLRQIKYLEIIEINIFIMFISLFMFFLFIKTRIYIYFACVIFLIFIVNNVLIQIG